MGSTSRGPRCRRPSKRASNKISAHGSSGGSMVGPEKSHKGGGHSRPLSATRRVTNGTSFKERHCRQDDTIETKSLGESHSPTSATVSSDKSRMLFGPEGAGVDPC